MKVILAKFSLVIALDQTRSQKVLPLVTDSISKGPVPPAVELRGMGCRWYLTFNNQLTKMLGTQG